MPTNYNFFLTKSGNRYLYDSVTNTVHPWNPPLNESIAAQLYSTDAVSDEVFDSLTADFPKEFQNNLRLWRFKTGAFRKDPPSNPLSFNTLEDIPSHRAGKLRFTDLILIVSEACNLRCSYCVFSSLYEGYRTHAGKRMSWDVAKSSIDLFFAYNDNPKFEAYSDRALNLVFYGGEPLLNFDVIQRAVLYAEQVQKPYQEVLISISTNLTLLSAAQLLFFRDHGVFLNVSLDGPPEEHNRYRMFADGKPSAETVLEKLNEIREFDEDYFFSRVSLLPTINGNSNLKLIMEFFNTHRNELPPIKLISLLKDMEDCEFHRVYPYDEEFFRKNADYIANIYYQNKINGTRFERGQFLYHFFEESLEEVYHRLHAHGLGSPDWYTGMCSPERKLAVYPDGNIHLCERINEYHPIGHINTGIDEEMALQTLNNYFASTPNCGNCWARNFCKLCMAATCDLDEFNFNMRCDSQRASANATLGFLFSILEKRPDAFSSNFDYDFKISD